MRVRLISDSLEVRLCIYFVFQLFCSLTFANAFDNNPIGGTISTADPTEICIGDDVLDVVHIDLEGNVGDSSLFLRTSDLGVILEISEAPYFDLTGLDENSYRLIHVSYDEFTVGPRIGLNIVKLKGWFGLSNQLTINLFAPFGGIVRAVNDIEQPICVNDGIPDNLTLRVSSAFGEQTGWLVADSNGTITQLLNSPTFNFEGTAPGTMSIHHYAGFGIDELRLGQNINRIRSCVGFSRPFIVEKTDVCTPVCDIVQPIIEFPDEQISLSICVVDDIPDVLTISNNLVGSTFAVVILGPNGNVLQVDNSSSTITVGHSSEGICQVFLLNFLDEIPVIPIGAPLSDFSGCFEISNPLQLIKEVDCAPVVCDVDGGTISIANGDEPIICVDDGLRDELVFNLTGNQGASTWVVTDNAGVIQSIQNDPVFNFEGIALSSCVIRHLSIQDPINNFGIGQNIDLIEGCFSFSNGITVTKQTNCGVPVCNVIGGLIDLSGEPLELTICVDDGEADLITPMITNNIGRSAFLITDTLGNILMVSGNNNFNLEGSGEGVCQIWHISFDETLRGLEAGTNVNDLNGCFSFSNPITITKQINCGFVCDVEGGTIVLENGQTSATICIEDDTQNTLTVELSGNSGPSTWLVTDLNGNIIAIQNSRIFNFEDAQVSNCQIWHLSLRDPITGFGIGRNVSEIEGCIDLSNPINITKLTGCLQVCDVLPGTISFGGLTQFNVCVDDGLPDNITPTVSNNSGITGWILVDEQGTLLVVQDDPIFQFEGTMAGTCTIYHISYDQTIMGLVPGENVANLSGCFALSNGITVNRSINCGVPNCPAVAGTISLNGQQTVTFCVTDAQIDLLSLDITGQSNETLWVVTDQNGIIILIQQLNNFNFTNAPTGTTVIWNVATDGNLTGLVVGQDINNLDGCFALSNSFEVITTDNCNIVCNVNGGDLDINGQRVVDVCVTDNMPDVLTAELTANVGSSIWLVTDQNGIILRTQNSPIFDFTNEEVGICVIWHLSLQDPISGFSIGANVNNITGCIDLSNSVQINKIDNCGAPVCDVDGGTITVGSQRSIDLCVVDTDPDIITVDLVGNSGSSIWLLTDQDGTITQIQNTGTFDFSSAEVGTCLIWHLSLQDPITGFSLGANAEDLGGCLDFSNPITVTKMDNCGAPVCDAVGGSIAVGGETALTFCVVDNEPDQFSASLTGNVGSSIFLETDSEGNIILIQNTSTFDFTNASVGTSFIWHLSFTGNIDEFAVGANVNQLVGCFALSNSIQVDRIDNCGAPVCDVVGGSIAVGGETALTFCVVDNEPDQFSASLTGNVGSSIFLETDSEGNILQIQNTSTFDFTNAGVGTSFIWHLSLTGNLEGFAVGANVNQLVGCFALSNSIQINRIDNCGAPVCDVVGGSIDYRGETVLTLCVVDNEPDQFIVSLTGNVGSSIFLETDSEGNILQVQNTSTFDFTNASVGTSFIWHLSLTGNLDGFAVGANVNQLAGCFALSNSIQVNRIDNCGAPVCDVNGGNIDVAGEAALTICVTDNEADFITVSLEGNTGSSTWILSDNAGNILQIQNSPVFDFTTTPVGNCLIWHLSLTGSLDGFALGANLVDISGCFDLSNSIAINKIDNCGGPVCDVDGGSITFADGSTNIEFCTSDGVSDVPEFILQNNTGSSTWIVTNSMGEIIEINPDGVFNFEGFPAGVCFITHLSILDPVTGFVIGGNIDGLSGCMDRSNSLNVTRITDCGPPPCDVLGGTILAEGGATNVTVCVDDGVAEGIAIDLQGNVGPSTWIVTDGNGIILEIQNSNIFSFEGDGEGISFIYHLSLDNTITNFGLGESVDNLGGCFSLSNGISVTRQINCGPDPCVIDGGNLTLANGDTSITFCADDGQNDVLDIVLTGNVGATTFILTDLQGMILDIQGAPNFNFEGSEAGNCLVYHMSLLDPISGFILNGNISDIEGCFELSNPISVTKVTQCGPTTCMVDGGIVMTTDNLTGVDVCTTDGINDNIQLMVQNFDGARLWVVTDAGGEIINIQVEDAFNFEGTGSGTLFIYNIVLIDPIVGFDIGGNIASIQGCFDLSNPISVNRITDCTPDPIPLGGNISTQAGALAITVCADDGLSDLVTVTIANNQGQSTWIATDTTGQILIVQAGPTFEFEGLGEGVCQIWNVASFGDLVGLQAGQNIVDVTGNFALSNQVTVTREVGCGQPDCTAEGGNLSLTNNETFTIVCVTDDEPDIITVELSGNVGTSNYLVTDPDGNILSIQNDTNFDIGGTTVGRCFIWHLSSQDDLVNFAVGQNVNSITGCFDLSNFIEVSKIENCSPLVCDDIRSGSISVMDETAITVCVNDGINDNVVADVDGNVGGSIWITTDANDIILDTQNDNVFNFEGELSGQCFIRHIAVLDAITGLIPGNSISALVGCFQISNRLEVNRILCSTEACTISGGAISTTNNETSVAICVTDNMSDIFTVNLTGNSGISQFIVTDSVGIIIGIQDGSDPDFDFESSAIGMCQVWHISTIDSSFNLMLDMDVALLEGCFSLSNPITVTRLGGDCANPICNDILAGSITFTDGSVDTLVCIDDGINENLNISLTGNTGAGIFIVTTETGLILDLENDPFFNFEGSAPGVCLIYHASLLDPFGGLIPGLNITDVTGCVNLSNILRVEKVSCMQTTCMVSGGTLATSTGLTEITVCADDEIADPIDFTLSGESGISMWLFTDSTGEVIETFDGSTVDFEGSDVGRCLIVHASVQDSSFIIREGDNTNDLTGCFALSNAIIVNKEINCAVVDTCDVVGGVIATTEGLTELSICAEDGISDAFEIDVMDNVGEFSVFIITDSTGLIIGLQLENIVDLEGIGEGMCFVYHASLRDSISGGELGQSIDDLTGCVAISNAITVIRDGGTFEGGSIASVDGSTEVTICDDDGVDALVNLTLTGNTGAMSAWLLIDDSGNVVQVFNTGPPFAIPDGTEGTTIFHIAFSPNFIDLTTVNNISDLEGCFDLSNFVALVKDTDCATMCNAMASSLSFDDGTDTITVCADDGIDELVNVNVTNASTDSIQWLVTDTTGLIISLSDGPPFNFEGGGPGVCQIWQLAFQDGITGLNTGGNAAGIQGCFALSNPLTVVKEIECSSNVCLADGGSITINGGQTSVNVCSGDGFEDVVLIEIDTLLNGFNEVFLVTDTLGTIMNIEAMLDIDFEGFAEGTFLIYNLSFIDTVGNVLISGNIDDITGCTSLSNSVEIIVEVDCMACPAEGGVIALDDGTQSAIVCAGDGEDNFLSIDLTGESGEDFFFLVTDTAGVVVNVQDGPNFDFDGSGPGDLQIWHISTIGTVTGIGIGQDVSGFEGCFDLSNPIFVMRNFVDGGSVEADSMQTEVTICVGDNEPDVITLFNDSESDFPYTYLITDLQNRFLAINIAGSVDLEGLTVGRCRIYGVSHPGLPNEVFTISAQQDVTQIPIAPCFELSDNFIQIDRVTGDNCPGAMLEEPSVSLAAMGNPVDQDLILDIQSENITGLFSIELRDVNGQLILAETMEVGIGTTTKTIDVSSLSVGIYYATVRHPSVVVHERIVVQH